MLRWIAVAVALRVVLGAAAWATRGEAAFLQQDSHTYLALAESMVVDSAFESTAGGLEVFRTPGYPLLISLGASFGAAVAVTLAIQLALTVLLMSLVFAIVERATGSATTGRVAAAAAGLEPTLLLWSIQIMPETLLAVTLLAFIWSAQRFFERQSARMAAAAALSVSAAACVKPIAYPLVVLLVIAAGLWSFFLRSQPRLRTLVLVFVAICASGLGAWHVRNGVGAGYWGFSTQIDHALYLSAAGAVRARLEGERYADVRQRMLAAAADLPATAESGGLSRFQMMRQTGWQSFRSAPLTFALVHMAGMFRTLFDPGAVEYFRLFGAYPENGGLLGRAVDRGLLYASWELARTRPAIWWSTVALALLTWPYVLFAVWSCGRARARMQPAGLLATVCATYLLIAGGGVPGSSRFRAPAVPLLVISAALARSRVGRAPLPSPAPDR